MEPSEPRDKSVILPNLDSVMGSAKRILEELNPSSPVREGAIDRKSEWSPASSSSDDSESSSDEYLPPKGTAVIKKGKHTIRQHECAKCEKVFRTRTQLMGHMRGVHVLPKHRCEDCQAMFKRKSHLKRHKNRRPKHCRLALYKKNLIADKNNGKDAQDNAANILKRIPHHKCHHCNRVFTRGEHLRYHLSVQPTSCLETQKAIEKQKKNDDKRNDETMGRAPSIQQPETNKVVENQSTSQKNCEDNSQKFEEDSKQQIQQLRGMVKSCLSEILNLRKRMRELEKQVTVVRQQEERS